MKSRSILLLLFCFIFISQAVAADQPVLQVSTGKTGALVNVERVIEDGKVLLSVTDAARNPVFGLTRDDFIVTAGGRKARIISAQPAEKSLDVPRSIALVLDNSYSMEERDAIEPLLEGVSELLKIVRPIDKVQIIVFGKQKKTIGGKELTVVTFDSSDITALNKFVSGVYREGITSKTLLYEGMLAGLEFLRGRPEDEPRFLVVFSDGEDLNSSYGSDDVFKALGGLGRFNAYAIDFMPGPQADKFLTEFAEGNKGQIWKATSGTSLVNIFQSVASKMQYYYVVSYIFPTTGSLAAAPASITIDEVESLDLNRVEGGVPAKKVASRIDASSVTLRPAVDTAYSVAKWKAAISNADGILGEQAAEGALPAEIVIPLRTDDLGRLAAGGDIKVSMEVLDSKGQKIVLTAPPVRISHSRTTGSLTATPPSIAIDEVESVDASRLEGGAPARKVSSRVDASSVTLRPVVNTVYTISMWKAVLANSDGTLSERAITGPLPEEIVLPLKTDDPGRLAAGGDIKVSVEVLDSKGQNIVLTAPPVKVNHFKTTGSLTAAPSSLTIEEIRTIDASPMLGHIYFSKDSSEIPSKYLRLAAGDVAGFDEHSFRDTLEKYYQVLNITGKRMTEQPEAIITLTGCNDNTGKEKGNVKLSKARAEAVRDYLQSVWGIAPERFRIEARNLPKMPSTGRLEEGRADNRRVEITSDNPAITDLIKSTYYATRIDASTIIARPAIKAAREFAGWTVAASNSRKKLAEVSGEGRPPEEIGLPLREENLREMAAGGDIRVVMEARDRKDQKLEMTAVPVKVNFLETSQLMAQKQDVRVQEKYALILFDFDKDTIDARNQAIVNTIVARIKALPLATVDIVGHTDNIGKEAYNLKLSERRALAVFKLLAAAYGDAPADRLHQKGVGPNDPLYDNSTSEARAFNRTVTITLEYTTGN